MKKIAYIELDTHAEIARNFTELMKDSKEFLVDYYYSEKIITQFKSDESTIFLSENTELLNQLSQKKYDLIIIGTVHRYFNLFKEITQKYNTSVIVHNLNFTKISRLQLFKNIFKKDFTYRLKLWLKEDLRSAPDVFKGAKNLLVLDKSLIKEKFKYLPVFFNEFQETVDSKGFTIVIPGAVSQERRDYLKVFKQLKNLNDNSKGKEFAIRIVFLGKAADIELRRLKDLKQRTSHPISIKYFTEKVPQNLFDEWMNKSDYLWCPVQNETQFLSNKEIYGKTKMSGNIGDAIKYGKMAVFPVDKSLNYPFLIPQNDSLKQQILDFQESSGYDFSSNYDRAKIAMELEFTLQSLL